MDNFEAQDLIPMTPPVDVTEASSSFSWSNNDVMKSIARRVALRCFTKTTKGDEDTPPNLDLAQVQGKKNL